MSTNIHPFVGPAKDVKKVRLNTSTKTTTCRVEGLGHKIFTDNFFSSPRLFMTWTDVK
jgi:hypothetical protein